MGARVGLGREWRRAYRRHGGIGGRGSRGRLYFCTLRSAGDTGAYATYRVCSGVQAHVGKVGHLWCRVLGSVPPGQSGVTLGKMSCWVSLRQTPWTHLELLRVEVEGVRRLCKLAFLLVGRLDCASSDPARQRLLWTSFSSTHSSLSMKERRPVRIVATDLVG